ncbi:MAG: FHA domain-containing protein [Candidatus Caenarcaniphilales bacterium]|nr:FHA domain-containing protein [Candidatus Caenarcaniphilales bacterium]
MSRARLLLINEQGNVSQEFEINESSLVIGRAPQSNLVLSHEDISRTHAQILRTPQGYFVSDMGSTNGTFLNGAVIKAKQMFQLKSNDQVNLGNVSLMFQVVPDTFPNPTNLNYSLAEAEEGEPMMGHATNYVPKTSKTINNNQEHPYLTRKIAHKLVEQSQMDFAETSNIDNKDELSLISSKQVKASSVTLNPKYLPPEAESISINVSPVSSDNSLSDEELKLAQEIFGNEKDKKHINWSGWTKMDLFKQKVNQLKEKPSGIDDLQGFNEEDLFNKIIGDSKQISLKKEVSHTPDYDLLPSVTTSKELVLNQNEAKTKLIAQFSNEENLIASVPDESSPIEFSEKMFPNDNASYYYPKTSNQSSNSFSLEYSFDDEQSENERDPFEALKYKDNDSLLSKFISNENVRNDQESTKKLSEEELKKKLKVHHQDEKFDFKEFLKKQLLPIGLILGSLSIAIVMYFRNSGLFG